MVFEMPCVCSLSTLNQAGILARMETVKDPQDPLKMGVIVKKCVISPELKYFWTIFLYQKIEQ